jgi:hemerythrin-like domain-containing protein
MTGTLRQLHEEHRRVEKLLLVLEEELALFDRQERPDYEVLQAAMDFFQDYLVSCHDPKERLIFECLKARDPEAAARLGGLEVEHAQDAGRLLRLSYGLSNILNDRDVPREAFHDAVRDFIAHVRHEINVEERMLFPAAINALQPEDWEDIKATARDTSEERLQLLCERILEWENSNRAARMDAQ